MMARDKYLEKFIDSRFADLKEDLKVIKEDQAKIQEKNDERNDDRDKFVKDMDKENKKRLDALEKDVGFVKNLFKGACALIAATASGVGLWKGLR